MLVGSINNFRLNGFGSMSAYIAGVSTMPAQPFTVDWGHVIRFSVRAKWLRRAQRLKKFGRLPRLGGFAIKALMASYVMTVSILVVVAHNIGSVRQERPITKIGRGRSAG